MDPMVIFGVFMVIFVIGVLGFERWRMSVINELEKGKLEEEKAIAEAYRKRSLSRRVHGEFAVEVDTISDRATQDEIVRCVNLLACQVARDCVSHSRSYDRRDDSASDAADSKRRWLEARNIAIEVCPELEGRMPHFGEFEPLKSYNTEHLI